LGPVLKAVGLKAIELQNLLPAAGTCGGCIGSSPIHLFINNLKIKDVTGLESVKIIGHSITPPNALKLVVGVPKDTDIKVTLSGSLDLKHKCSKCAPLIGADDKNWKLLSQATNLSVMLTLKKGELATACASYDLSSSVPLVVHTLATSAFWDFDAVRNERTETCGQHNSQGDWTTSENGIRRGQKSNQRPNKNGSQVVLRKAAWTQTRSPFSQTPFNLQSAGQTPQIYACACCMFKRRNKGKILPQLGKTGLQCPAEKVRGCVVNFSIYSKLIIKKRKFYNYIITFKTKYGHFHFKRLSS
jgi:hypothetical protein